VGQHFGVEVGEDTSEATAVHSCCDISGSEREINTGEVMVGYEMG
jgi:hypothetical protein